VECCGSPHFWQGRLPPSAEARTGPPGGNGGPSAAGALCPVLELVSPLMKDTARPLTFESNGPTSTSGLAPTAPPERHKGGKHVTWEFNMQSGEGGGGLSTVRGCYMRRCPANKSRGRGFFGFAETRWLLELGGRATA
jgi:hypothetical protein